MPETNSKFPRARVDKIISRKVQDELIIYDLARHVATCLNSFAADVWDRCDGHSSSDSSGAVPKQAEAG